MSRPKVLPDPVKPNTFSSSSGLEACVSNPRFRKMVLRSMQKGGLSVDESIKALWAKIHWFYQNDDSIRNKIDEVVKNHTHDEPSTIAWMERQYLEDFK